jgi:hypothetical protein
VGVAIECGGSRHCARRAYAVRVTERVRDCVPSGRNGMVGSDTREARDHPRRASHGSINVQHTQVTVDA